MCLIVFSYKSHDNYPLILAGNRDEFFDRPAEQAHFWDTNPPLLAGKDLKAGGTWLGISLAGEMGALTNYRDLKQPRQREKSRGELIPDVLLSSEPMDENLKSIIHRGHLYDGFNMIAGNRSNLYYINNITNRFEKVEPGNYGISNAFLNTPWPKVENAKKEFSHIISQNDIDEEAIFTLLKNRETYPLDMLPNTGLTPEMEKAVSSIFIDTKTYGTRCSTLLMIDRHDTVTFIERSYTDDENNSGNEKRFEFEIE